MTVKIDLTGIDISINATTRGGTRRLNIQEAGAAMNLTGVASFTGEILASNTAAIGTGTAITWPVVDGPGGGVACTIPTGQPVGTTWAYVKATVAGSVVEISGPLRITAF